MGHITVLQHEAVNALALTPASVVVDATLGAGGHAATIVSQLGRDGIFIGIDVDESAVVHAEGRITGAPTIHLVVANFAELDTVLDGYDLPVVNAILADLGWRTEQFEASGRGFSFNDEVGLAMTFGQASNYDTTAATIVNEWDESDIANVLFGYGEERYARKIAKGIVEARHKQPITTGKALAEVIAAAVPPSYRRGRTHPATKSFQALRIAVNNEFSVLESFIGSAFARLASGGRLAIITFHSLEDRIVKLAFKAYTHDQTGLLVHKKPITPTREELLQNPRSRSAKLRIIQKL